MSEHGTDRALLPAPTSEGLPGEFFGWHTQRELRFQRCAVCRHWSVPATINCANCGSSDLAWERCEGKGTVFSWTRTHNAFDADFMADGPYVCAIVEVDEGPRLLTSLHGRAATGAEVGLRVKVDFAPRAGDQLIAVFVADDR
ncbi:MAG: OB-fold domain-containing protein [Acidimicrobiales bacterium]